MRDFRQVLSPLSWLMLIGTIFPVALVLFRPTFTELLVYCAAECVGLLLTLPLERRLSLLFFPRAKLFFPETNHTAIRALSTERIIDLYYDLARFPKQRAAYSTLMSVIKLIPATLVVIFYWDHGMTTSMAAFKAISVSVFIGLAYFYCAVFIEHHHYVSKLIAELHRTYDWSMAFHRLPTKHDIRNFALNENIGIAVIWIFLITLQVAVHYSSTSTTEIKALESVVINLCGLALASRLWYLSRKYFIAGLDRLFNTFSEIDAKNFRGNIPFHSSPLLARFEGTINLLVEKLLEDERELSQLVVHETEKSRYTALGEFSALIAHDLASPLAVINFCASNLQESDLAPRDRAVAERLSSSSARAIELLESLRAYLKPQDASLHSSNFSEACEHAVKIIRSQFYKTELDKIVIEVHENLKFIELAIPRPDLVHIILNLYGNAIKDLATSKKESGFIKAELVHLCENFVEILVVDNGSGLSREEFEEMTGYTFIGRPGRAGRKGLGLRLIRRLVERHGGTLEAEEASGTSGTTLRLRLQRYSNPKLVVPAKIGTEVTGKKETHAL